MFAARRHRLQLRRARASCAHLRAREISYSPGRRPANRNLPAPSAFTTLRSHRELERRRAAASRGPRLQQRADSSGGRARHPRSHLRARARSPRSLHPNRGRRNAFGRRTRDGSPRRGSRQLRRRACIGRTVAEGHGNSTAGLCVQVEPSSVDARPCDHAAGHIRHGAGQRSPTRREYQPYAVIATRGDGEGSRRRFVSFRRCCDRPLPSREIDRSVPIARGLDDHDVTIRRSATHPCIGDWAGAIGDGNDNVRRRIARHGKRSSRAGSELALGSAGRLACPLVMLVELGADKTDRRPRRRVR